MSGRATTESPEALPVVGTEGAQPAAQIGGPPVAAPPAALLVLSGVGKDYDSGAGVVRALRHVDLSVKQGEFVAIIGTSGSGKSTLMNILGCLDRPTRGTYTLAGVDVGARTADGRAIVRNRVIGFIFQGFNLLSRTTALENVELPLSYRGVSAKERRARAEAALASVGLAGRTDHTPNQLSGGQQQRVAIARALVTDPPLLLADEPTGNLDTRTSLEVLALLQKLNEERGITIVLVTHEPDIARCAKRIITVRDGNIVDDKVIGDRADAAHELSLLPPPEVFAPAADKGGDPALTALMQAQKNVPKSVVWRLLFGTTLGAILGWAYGKYLVDHPVLWLSVVLGILFEGWLLEGYIQSKWGHRASIVQMAKVAIYYPLVLATVAALGMAVSLPERFVKWAQHVGTVGYPKLLGIFVAALLASALLRLASYAFFSWAGLSRPSKKAGHAKAGA